MVLPFISQHVLILHRRSCTGKYPAMTLRATHAAIDHAQATHEYVILWPRGLQPAAMKWDKIGILELKNDPFAIDLASRLSDLPVEFLSFADSPAPVSTDYKVVIDRMSFRYAYLKEMVKNMSLDGTYVVNNPFAASVNSKLVEAKVCQALGYPFSEVGRSAGPGASRGPSGCRDRAELGKDRR